MHSLTASTLDEIAGEIDSIQRAARAGSLSERPRWPMIVLRTPKGWTGPKVVDGLPAEGSSRSHQVPLANLASNPEHVAQLEEWMRSYRPEELFDTEGTLRRELADLAPRGNRRMGAISEHLREGWLEGYLLTGRHGLFNCHEALIHIIDSMFNQHAKWLKVTRGIAWRASIASLNYLLSSHVWRQDHNGCSHQHPGFIREVGDDPPDVRDWTWPRPMPQRHSLTRGTG